ncbi:lactate racemase domain-containing protein [Occallatibacter savannae]|uniref:lactate racemase domain-containing protein n=1 Tax=Occallatibacter savannae TaxID=1002691 RepID=UPI000D6901E0|nr:lactate racemase domain-containing protein [Occallatibacter savannae]
MALYCAIGGVDKELTTQELSGLLRDALEQIDPRNRVLAVPPDITRLHSQAGSLTCAAHQILGDQLKAILPALGTHTAMTPKQMDHMFPGVPRELFKVHNWRTDVETLGEVPAEFIREVSEGKVDFAWPAQVNRQICSGEFDLILSIGQVVPHEVIGMANYNKNILVGTGGRMGINRSHYLGAVYGMERIMGRADNPVRAVLNYASDKFLRDIPLVYVHTVVGRDENGQLAVRGLFVGDDIECFHRAAELSVKVNFEMVDRPIRKAVVFLDPREFHSTWLGNKAVYRTRMALGDDAELIVLAPAVREFGEDKTIDSLIRKYGYHGTSATLKAVEQNEDLAAELGAAAHLIHGSSEGRFKITWCPGELTREEIQRVGFAYADLDEMMELYNPHTLSHGWNTVRGEEIFFIANPGLGLWAHKSRLQ